MIIMRKSFLIKVDLELIEMLELVGKNIKGIIIIMFYVFKN